MSETQQRESTLELAPRGEAWCLSTILYLHDRPGELAQAARFMAEHGANIQRFFYNRSVDPGRIELSVLCPNALLAGTLAGELEDAGYLTQRQQAPQAHVADDPALIDLAGLLRIRVSLEDRPGALAEFAALVKEHGANVIHMIYDGDEAPGMAEISLAASSPDQVQCLLSELDGRGCHYTVQWQGAEGCPVDEVIGLNAVEAFLLKLKAILPPDRLARLREMILSSDEMSHALIDFRRESGEDGESMAVSEVFGNILHLAATSWGRTGAAFTMRMTGPVHITERVSLYMLACPTGANAFLLQHDGESTLIDSGYGLYWPDARQWLSAHGFDPSRIRRVLVTHPDADHAGWAAPLHEEYGAEVYMHPEAMKVFENENRAHGTGTRLQALNVAFTKLIIRFTELRAPASICPFPEDSGELGGFRVMGALQVGDVELKVLESKGGHVVGQVFFYAPDQGLLFCGDYLIDIASLSRREKGVMSVPKYLMTSTNSDSRVFGQEMAQLRALMCEAHNQLHPQGGTARIFSGHGDLYCVDDMDWLDTPQQQ